MANLHEKTFHSNNFIQLIREERHRSDIINDVFLITSEEAPRRMKIIYNTLLCNAIQEENRQDLMEQTRDLINMSADEDLCDLGIKLRAAYISKALAAQEFEKEACESAQKLDSHISYIVGLSQARYTPEEHRRIQREEAQAKKESVERDLSLQIAENQAKREEERQEIIKDRERSDQAQREYKADLAREARQAAMEKIHNMKDFNNYLADKRDYEEKQKLAVKEHDDSVLEMQNKIEMMKQMAKQHKKNKLDRQIEITEEIGRRTFEVKKAEEERMDLLIDLLIDEKDAKVAYQDKLREKQKKDLMVASRCEMERALGEKQKRKIDDRWFDERPFFDKYNKIKDLKAKKKRQEALEYEKSLRKANNDEKRKIATDMKLAIMKEKLHNWETNEKNKSVNKTRQKLLKEHIPHIRGYLHPRKLSEADRRFIAHM